MTANHTDTTPARFDDEPPVAWSKFLEGLGVTSVTGWRWRKKGMLDTVNIHGRAYVTRSEIRRFNQRVASGEFTKAVYPRKRGGRRLESETALSHGATRTASKRGKL